MTVKQYLATPKLMVCSAKILAIICAKTTILRLDRTIFHPQGGGQKADKGLIGSAVVTHVTHNADCVDHQVESAEGLAVGDTVQIKLDEDWRRLNAVYHTAGHLLAAVVEAIYPGLHAVSGHQWPGEGRVEFSGNTPATQISAEEIHARLTADLAQSLSVTIESDPFQTRTIRIGDYPAIPCGGTHVGQLGEIASILVTGIKAKSGRIRISFEAQPSPGHPQASFTNLEVRT
ncbi:MAG: hypothetical protein H6R07_1410 [Proteobacteria bacterium]|nr:hypothetical protein [Pseudomonadota bacterium]